MACSTSTTPAAKALSRRKIVGSEATGPHISGSARSVETSARQPRADREHQRKISNDLARIMSRELLPPRRRRPGELDGQAPHAQRMGQQNPAGLADRGTGATSTLGRGYDPVAFTLKVLLELR